MEPLDLHAEVPHRGAVCLRWPRVLNAEVIHVLLERGGTRPSYTCLAIAGTRTELRLENLGSRQRYLVSLVVSTEREALLSPRWSVTPDPSLPPLQVGTADAPVTPAALSELLVMPQDRRLTLFFISNLVIFYLLAKTAVSAESCAVHGAYSPSTASATASTTSS